MTQENDSIHRITRFCDTTVKHARVRPHCQLAVCEPTGSSLDPILAKKGKLTHTKPAEGDSDVS